MERVILFHDIGEYILPIRMEAFQIKLAINYIYFLISTFGGNNKLLLHLSDGNENNNWSIHDTNIQTCKYLQEIESIGYDINQYLPKHEDIIANLSTPQTSIELEYQKLIPKEFSLFSTETTNEEEENIELLSSDIVEFIQRTFTYLLEKYPSNSNLFNIKMNFEIFYNRTNIQNSNKLRSLNIKNTCKSLLIHRSNDLQLWHQYALAELNFSHFNESKRILDTALSLSSFSNDCLELYLSYSSLELFHPTFLHVKFILARVLHILISSTESNSFSRIFVNKKQRDSININQDDHFSSNDDLSKYPPNILPKITPTRVLFCKQVSFFIYMCVFLFIFIL